MTDTIPDKLFFKIGEVARIADVEPHVLRYWETEFHNLKPGKNGKGQRVYKKKDVVKVLEIKKLLYHDRFSIEGARKKIGRKSHITDEEKISETLSSIKTELNGILGILKKSE